MSGEEPTIQDVAGERAAALVHRARGLQSRMGSVFALGLMVSIGVGALTWYYAHIWQEHAGAPSRTPHRAAPQTDVPLPPLGRIDPPPATAAPTDAAAPAAGPAAVEIPLTQAPLQAE